MVLRELCPARVKESKLIRKLIRAAIQIASKSLNNENYDLMEIAEKVVREDGRTLS